MPSLTAEQIVAIGSMMFAGLAGLLTAYGAIRSRRDAINREDEEEMEAELRSLRRRLAHAHSFISTLTLAAVKIRHVAAERLMRAGDDAPLPEVPVFQDLE
ncbi:hypothetical protein SAMN02745194_03076 [Roseomonas rosea]|uniref:Uncharacterized protein n=1 Tax=Muricoccus roseus TaxID=198092 RepID=A0A1M6L7V1_9PROT|nr:hypothetical protein [Roseomonas rosea]SHJ67276.1 hypothetical protein SAMN02745194_03076 [Roseomonas rosea]